MTRCWSARRRAIRQCHDAQLPDHYAKRSKKSMLKPLAARNGGAPAAFRGRAESQLTRARNAFRVTFLAPFSAITNGLVAYPISACGLALA